MMMLVYLCVSEFYLLVIVQNNDDASLSNFFIDHWSIAVLVDTWWWVAMFRIPSWATMW